MVMSINTNIGAMVALQNLSATNRDLAEVQNRVATGLRVAQVKDDSASFTIAGRMDADIQSLESVKTGIGMAEAVLGTAVGAAEQIADLLKEMKAKAIQASSGGLSTADRNAISNDISTLQDQIGTITATGEFNNLNLISSNETLLIAGDKDGGNRITVSGATLDAVVTVNVTTVTNAVNTATSIQTRLNTVLGALADFGSAQQRVESQRLLTDTLLDSLTAGVGSLIDADMAKESSRLQSLQIQQQLGVQALGIANSSPQTILGLFG
jgi:flagellin